MRRRPRTHRACVIPTLALLAAANPAAAQDRSIVSGQVVDAANGRPISGVLVQVAEVRPSATNATGFFVLVDVPPGEHLLQFSHLGYGDHQEGIAVEAGDELSLTVRMSVEAIALEPFVVEAWTELDERRRTSGHSMNEIGREQIEAAARSGMGLTELLQTSMPGTMATQSTSNRTCVMYRAIRSGGTTACREVTVILDGVQVAAPSYLYQTMPLDDIERIEMLSPGQAGMRYGTASGQAVLLIETQRGFAQRRADVSRFVTGFTWTGESEPYGWFEVLGKTFVANALLVAGSLALADNCLSSRNPGSLDLRTRCNGFNTASVGVLSVAMPSIAGGLIARSGGQTTRTRGRLAPTALAAGMTLTGGYLLVIQGGDKSSLGGYILLAAGVPVTLAVADRIFRVLRDP